MDITSILTPPVIILLILSGCVTNALVIGVVAWGAYKLAPAIASIPNEIASLRVAVTARLEALEERMEKVQKVINGHPPQGYTLKDPHRLKAGESV